MKSPTYLKEVSAQAVRLTQETLREIPQIVVSTEERVRQKVRSTLRLIVAALFFLIGNVVTLGINVSLALAKKTGTEQTREKRGKGQQKVKLKLKESLHAGKKSTRSAKLSRATGKASWYGKQFHNRRTASGVRYNMYTMMAAHKTLPFGTLVKVTNLDNGKTCVVEITDRGPYVGSRIIDLSYAAANELEFASKGVADVKLEILGEVTPEINFAEHIRQPKPEFDVLPHFPERLMLDLREARKASYAAVEREN
jgi:rare lipoprotein A (peptidoglycan hydrolase)